MENYIVKALINFDDVEKKVKREKDKSIWNCTKERYEFLKSHNAVMLMGIEEIKKEEIKPIENKVEEKPKRTRKKKVED